MRGDVDLEFRRGIRLDAPLVDVTSDGRANLHAAAAAIGQSRDPRTASGSPFTVSQQGASPVLATRTGSGLLSVQAETIDLFGSFTINGVSETRLFSMGDIRMTGRNVVPDNSSGDRVFGAQVGSLTTKGNLLLSSAQIEFDDLLDKMEAKYLSGQKARRMMSASQMVVRPE